MNEQEFIQNLDKVGSKIDMKITLYHVVCKECVSYDQGSNSRVSWNWFNGWKR
jgi:hypothetical protein